MRPLGDLIRKGWGHQSSPKGERVGLGAGIEKADLERAVGDRAVLPDQLIKPLPVHDALAVGIHIGAMAVAGHFAVNRDPESDGLAICRAEHEVEIASVKPVDDAAVLAVEARPLIADRPISGQAPLVELRLAGGVDMRAVFDSAARRNEVLCPSVAEISFGRLNAVGVRCRFGPRAFTATKPPDIPVPPALARSCWMTCSEAA